MSQENRDDEYVLESSSEDIQRFVNENNDQYFNFDENEIKQYQFEQSKQKTQKVDEQKEENKPIQLKYISVKNQIASEWPEQDDLLFKQKTLIDGENTDFSKLLTLFPGKTEKDLRYHYQVLNQVWTLEQQQQLLCLAEQQLGRTDGKLDFDAMGKVLGKTRTQCKKHYFKLVQAQFTKQDDQFINEICQLHFSKLLNDVIDQDLFNNLQQQLKISKFALYERYKELRRQSDEFDKFWYKKDKDVALLWWENEKQKPDNIRNWIGLFTIINGYSVFDVQRLIQQENKSVV